MNILVVFASHWQWLSLGTYCPLSSFDTIHRCDNIVYSVASSSRNSSTLVRRSTRLPEWNNRSLWRNASMLMRRMLPVTVSVRLGRTMVEWYPYLDRWWLKIKHRCSKGVYVCKYLSPNVWTSCIRQEVQRKVRNQRLWIKPSNGVGYRRLTRASTQIMGGNATHRS